MMSFMDHWDSDGDDSVPDVDDTSTRYDDLVLQWENTDAEVDKDWTYLCHSNQGGEIFGGVPKRRVPDGDFNLKYNPTDEILLEKAKVEI